MSSRQFWPQGEPSSETGDPAWMTYVPQGVRALVRSNLPAELRGITMPGVTMPGVTMPGVTMPGVTVPGVSTPAPADERFLSRSFSNAAGTRPYRLYVPSSRRGEPAPLLVMLHGCRQSPEDFAAGTGMNEAAEREGWLVAYPGQPPQAHPHKCWKWFSAEDQERDRGEPSIIAGITRQVMRDHAVDPRRVFVAGLSAGGAAAAIMGAAYPELYAAIGVHSGLACGAARSLPAALAAMERGADGAVRARGGRIVPAIVFHGDRDTVVHSRNGDAVIAQSTGSAGLRRTVEARGVESGRECTRTLFRDAEGRVVTEQWLIHGAGHAWSGGRPSGSYTDPLGPDASAEMLRFFAAHPLA